MQRAMLQCNGVQSEVITEGRWVEEGLSPTGNKHVVVVIPGNPGVPQFYEGFIKAVNSRLPPETPVWIMGHAGHVQPPQELMVAMPDDWNDHYSLMAQVKHKAEFIKKYVPKDAKLHLVGHSIGCWMILNLLKDEFINERVVKCYLLFPTVERMVETKNGYLFTNFVARFAKFLLFMAMIFSFFPLFLQTFLIRAFGYFYGYSSKDTKAFQHLTHPVALKRIIKLGKEEMRLVREADHDVISKHSKKLWFYYGTTDGWVPLSYYEEMKSRHPDVEIELCKRKFAHSFTLNSDKEMGHIVGDLINQNIARA